MDHRTDIFSLACVLYESLTGVPPYSAPSAGAVVARMVTEDPEPVTRERPAAAPVEPILTKALARLPADRYATAAAFAQALRSADTASTPSFSTDKAPVGRGIRAGRERRSRRREWGMVGGRITGVGWPGHLGLGFRREKRPASNYVVVGRPSPLWPFCHFAISAPTRTTLFLPLESTRSCSPQLAKVEGIRLIGRASVEAYGDSERAAPEIAEELGVAAVLEGSVRRVDDQVRITVRLDSPDEDGPFEGRGL